MEKLIFFSKGPFDVETVEKIFCFSKFPNFFMNKAENAIQPQDDE